MTDFDAIIVGAGPAGASAAILLATAGWRVAMAEQHRYPRRKVCGECIAAGNLSLLDDLGIGPAFRDAAGPELRHIGWMHAGTTLSTVMPPCRTGKYAYGRALGRDRLDEMLVARARALGVHVLQPARVRQIGGELGRFECVIAESGVSRATRTLSAHVVIDAHGSWERGPALRGPVAAADSGVGRLRKHRPSDLFAFKANFSHTSLEAGFLPVLALPGGYGGMVVEGGGRATVACCIRRDTLSECRTLLPDASAGEAVEAFLRRSCGGVRSALHQARREGAWLAVGPLRTGIRRYADCGVFRVGNAAGESHALIGEGISMALQSSALLCGFLTQCPPAAIRGTRARDLQRVYAAAWRRCFATRLRMAAVYSHIAMRPRLATPLRMVLGRWPALLHAAARLAGKAAGVPSTSFIRAEIV